MQAIQPIGGVEVYLYSFFTMALPFLTTALEGGEGSVSRPGRALPPGNGPVPIVQEASSSLHSLKYMKALVDNINGDMRHVMPS